MKITAIDFLGLLPRFMQSDSAVRGLSDGVSSVVAPLSASITLLSTWDHIDELTESELDELAKELNILWYDQGASVPVKRELVKSSDMVHRRLGTKWAVENVINTYFGEGYVTEWFEYEGVPGHFRVYSTNPTISNDRLAEFLNLLGKVKRATAKLDGIFITLTGEMHLCAGVALHETAREKYAIGATPL